MYLTTPRGLTSRKLSTSESGLTHHVHGWKIATRVKNVITHLNHALLFFCFFTYIYFIQFCFESKYQFQKRQWPMGPMDLKKKKEIVIFIKQIIFFKLLLLFISISIFELRASFHIMQNSVGPVGSFVT